MASPTDTCARRRPVTLTARDLAVLAFIAANRAVPLDVLAARFFRVDPVTGRPNREPGRACERRLQALAAAGYVWRTAFPEGAKQRGVATLGPAAAGITGIRPERRRVPPKKRAHHVRTLDALALVEHDVRARGGRVVRTRLEPDLRLEQQGGRFTKRDDAFEPCPDAACTLDVVEGGVRRTLDVAVEYVTSKYTDADIAGKHEGFGGSYDRVMWFADRPRTAERVRKITGAPCTILR